MNETDICFMPGVELTDAIRTKKLSAVEVTRAVLDRIAALEPKLNAFAYLAADEAMETARAADRALASGEPVGPLHGVPVTIKDHEAVRGMQVEYGTYLRKGRGRGGGQCDGLAPAPGRRHHFRQDDDPRVRLEGRERESADGHHAQSVEARLQFRRLLGRR